jgi:hypothetical protein
MVQLTSSAQGEYDPELVQARLAVTLVSFCGGE